MSSHPDRDGIFIQGIKALLRISQKLTMILLFFLLRKGKEAITIGERARPSLSRIITRSDDIQLNSLKESAKLKDDFDDT